MTTNATTTPVTIKGNITIGNGSPIPFSWQGTMPETPVVKNSTGCFFGVWDPASGYPANTWAGPQKFAAAPVKSVSYYLAWLAPWGSASSGGSGASDLNKLAAQNGAKLYANLEAWNTWGNKPNPSMADIAAGKYDSYLTSLGAGIKADGVEVLVTFCHEMNGNDWYPWQQSGGVSPAQWVAAWKHVYTVIKAAAGELAQMVWCPNNNDVGPVTPYWPGQQYVDVVAADMYLNEYAASVNKTFESFNLPTITEIKSLTSAPIWNAETGLYPNAYYPLAQWVADMKAAGLSGFTYWNQGSFVLTAPEIEELTNAVNAWNAA